MKSIVCALLLTGLASAAVDGVVNNQTVGKPQPGAAITLVELTGGMKTVGSVKSDNDGKFHFDATLSPSTPHLIQAMHQGVTYNRVLPPGTDASALALEVFDSSAKAAEARVTQDMILLERSDKTLAVNETVIYTNTGKTTFQAPDGTLKIQVPPSVEEVKLRVTAPQGMPISRDAEKGKEAGIWLVRYP
ncbi:MAG: hypothetical protein H7Y20_17860, partial [Bryobacteraceae bacterium]|nr:hypothetical protein [Bryobacteraceae bacterium]